MLCKVCASIDLFGGFTHIHHASFKDLIAAADQVCNMCEAIIQETQLSKQSSTEENIEQISNTQIR